MLWPYDRATQNRYCAAYRRPAVCLQLAALAPLSGRRESVSAPSTRSVQGTGPQTPPHRCSDARESDLAFESVRLALGAGGRAARDPRAVAPSRVAVALALHVAAGTPANSAGAAPAYSAHGDGEPCICESPPRHDAPWDWSGWLASSESGFPSRDDCRLRSAQRFNRGTCRRHGSWGA